MFAAVMRASAPRLDASRPLVVGSIGDRQSLAEVSVAEARDACDLVEVRLDLLGDSIDDRPWAHLGGIPLLFTARRASEGGQGELDAHCRQELLRKALPDAALLDVEVASAAEMAPLLAEAKAAGVPWIGSFHDFATAPELSVLRAARRSAHDAGAIAFKAAVELGWESSRIPELASFVGESHDYPISLMGMGPLAPISRVLFAQLGSVLNYGYLGRTPTAPGQWSAQRLREAIHSVAIAG